MLGSDSGIFSGTGVAAARLAGIELVVLPLLRVNAVAPLPPAVQPGFELLLKVKVVIDSFASKTSRALHRDGVKRAVTPVT